MSGKELLKLDAKALATLSEAQLKEYFAPYLRMIRPEKEEEKKNGEARARVPKGPSELDKTKALFNRMAAKLGMKEL